MVKNNTARAKFSSAAQAPYDFHRVFGGGSRTLNSVNFNEFPELSGSMMKIIGGDVDT